MTTTAKNTTAPKNAKTTRKATPAARRKDQALAAAIDLVGTVSAPMPPTEGTRAPVATKARQTKATAAHKVVAAALAEIVGPRGAFVKGTGEKARHVTGAAPRDYRAVMLGLLREAVTVAPVHDGPLPAGADGHSVTRAGGNPGHVIAGSKVDIVPAGIVRSAASVGYNVAPFDVEKGKRKTTAPRVFAFTRPATRTQPAKIVTVTGWPVADVVAAIGAARVKREIRATPWSVVSLPAGIERDGLPATVAALSATIDAVATADAVADSDKIAATAARMEIVASQLAAGGKKASRDRAAGRTAARFERRRKRTADALQNVKRNVRRSRAVKGPKGTATGRKA
jgi:hypothetical protein